MLADALIIGLALFLVRFIASEAELQRAKRTGVMVRFPVGMGLRLLLRLGSPLVILAAYKVAADATAAIDFFSAAACAGLGIAGLFGEPGEIIATPQGLIQKSLRGLRKRKIAWEGAAASNPHGAREILVVGDDGTTITHSQYHVGHAELLAELKRHGVFVL